MRKPLNQCLWEDNSFCTTVVNRQGEVLVLLTVILIYIIRDHACSEVA